MAYESTTWNVNYKQLEREGKFIIVDEDDDTGNAAVFVFESENEYTLANDWYNSTSKGDIQAYCLAHGVDLRDSERPGMLQPAWATRAMVVYAQAALQA